MPEIVGYCPNCGREIHRKNNSWEGVYFCQPSCKTQWLLKSEKSSGYPSTESRDDERDDKDWGPEGRYVKSMWKAMK